MRAVKTSRPADVADEAQTTRREIADFCRYLGARLNGELPRNNITPIPATIRLSPRMRQTLDRLLAGDSEKQIAKNLSVSQHTVHVYVKSLYRAFEVNSRGELLARFVQVPPPYPNERSRIR